MKILKAVHVVQATRQFPEKYKFHDFFLGNGTDFNNGQKDIRIMAYCFVASSSPSPKRTQLAIKLNCPLQFVRLDNRPVFLIRFCVWVHSVVKVQQNNFLTGTIQYLSIPSQNFSHKYKKALKSTSTFGPPCIVHFKNTKNVRQILKTTVSKSTKKRQAKGYLRQLALSPKVVQAMQPE